MNIYEKLMNIQSELKAPKNQYSDFGKYHYRSCEDILEGLKPLLIKYKATLLIDSEIELIGDRYYVKAIATFVDIEKDGTISTTAYAREDENKAKMDLSQMTGSATSYARKYALNGLFAIDDTKDADANPSKKEQNNSESPGPQGSNKKSKPLSDAQIKRLFTLGNKAG